MLSVVNQEEMAKVKTVKAEQIPNTGRFDKMDSAVIISSVSKAPTLLMMTAEPVLSKRSVLRIAVISSSSLKYFRPIFIIFRHYEVSSSYYCIITLYKIFKNY